MKTSPLKRLEHSFKRFFFAVFSIFLRRGQTDFETIDPAGIRKVLFIRPEKLGDMIISLPVFHNLKKRHPHLELYVICSPRNVAVVRDDTRLTGHFLYTKRFWEDIRMLQQVRRLGPDVVVDMICDDSVTALFLSQLSSRRARHIGLGKNRHRRYYDFNYQYRTGDGAHVIDNTLMLLTAFGIETASLERYVPPTIPDAARAVADQFYQLLPPLSGGVIGLNISAGRPTRVWPDEKNEALVRLLLERYPSDAVVISADPQEQDRAARLAARFPQRVTAIPPGRSLLEVAAVISRLKILITPDTSMVHIARAFRVPVVGLYTRFGKNFELWRPYGQATGATVSNNDYNIFDIDVDAVVDAVQNLLPAGDA